MPLYSFINKKTNEEFTEWFSFEQLEQYLIENTDIQQAISSPRIAYRLYQKPDNAFRDRLKDIKSKHSKTNTIETF